MQGHFCPKSRKEVNEMKNQTTNQTATNRTDLLQKVAKLRFVTAHKVTTQAPTTSTAQDQKQNTTDHLNELMNHRNNLLTALEMVHDIKTAPYTNMAEQMAKEKFETIVHELCETIAQISVYKTLLKLSDSPKDISTSGAETCFKLYRSFSQDMAIYHHKDTTQTYSDAFDLFNIAYMQIWEYLHTTAPLTLDDTVLTVVKKNGDEKNYTIFQTACKSIREYIHSWSKSDNFKKLHYIVGIADNGEMVTSSKRPQDELTDIDQTTKTAFFEKYGLTAREQEILNLYIKGEKAETIATLLNLNLRMVQRDIKTAKSKFKTANAYAEYITATNAEKLARAKAEKHPNDSIYQTVYTQAQERTAKALQEWKKAFREENRTK